MAEPLPKYDTVVLVDFSNLAHTCWHPAVAAQEAGEQALAEHRAKCASCEMGDPCEGRPKQYDPKKVLLENIDLKFGTLAEDLGTSAKTWVMVKDGKDEWRRQLMPTYKGTREPMEFDPRPLAEEHIRSKGCRFCTCLDAEADDTIATMAQDLAEAGKKVIVVSSDKDLWQCWNPPLVRIYLTTKKEFLTREYMEKKLRISEPGQVRLVKALWGDPSDNIPNAVPRMQAQLVPFVKSSGGDLRKFWAEVGGDMAPVSKRCHELLTQNMEQVVTNWEVVGLRKDCEVSWI